MDLRGYNRKRLLKGGMAPGTSLLPSLVQELEKEKAARILAQKSEAQAIIQFQLARAECERLQQRVADLEARCVCEWQRVCVAAEHLC